MKEVILSADGEAMLYRVPDAVAENLETYCMEFASRWLWESLHAEGYRKKQGNMTVVSYTEEDFISYLNAWGFPEEPSLLVRGLGCDCGEAAERYPDLPRFNF